MELELRHNDRRDVAPALTFHFCAAMSYAQSTKWRQQQPTKMNQLNHFCIDHGTFGKAADSPHHHQFIIPPVQEQASILSDGGAFFSNRYL